jgi:hypothetical protein
MPEHRSTVWTAPSGIVTSFRTPTRQTPKFELVMRRHTPRGGVTAPRWFVIALLGGTAALTAATAVLPQSVNPSAYASTHPSAAQAQIFQAGSPAR